MKHNYLKHLFTVLLLLVATVAIAQDFEVDGIYYNITSYDDKTVEVTSNPDGYSGEVIIPEYVVYSGENYAVIRIGESAFYGCSGLTSIEIPNGVISIGRYAFHGCSGLTSVVIPNSVTHIGSFAFRACTGIKDLCFEDGEGELLLGGDGYMNYNAFFSDSPLETLYLGRDLSYNTGPNYGFSPFWSIATLKSLTIGNAVTNIGYQAFSSCYGLKDVHISDIEAWLRISFGSEDANPSYYAHNLYLNGELVTELVIPDGVTEIKDYAFCGCSCLTNLTIGNGVTYIGSYAFSGCSGLTGELKIPDGVTEIKDYAFYGCDRIVNVTIPASVTYIGSYAFNAAKGVFEIAAKEPATVGSTAFHANAVLTVPDAAVDAYKTAWSSDISRIVAKCDAFVTVDVEAKEATSGIMERIGINKMASITKLTVKGSINSYDVIQFRDKMPLLRELDLTESTVIASDKAFYNGNYTKDNDLGDYAFYELSKLNFVKLPKDLAAVGSYAFDGCSSLRELEVPETVQSIGNDAFNNCSALKKIKMPQTMTSIGVMAFQNCSSLEEITIPEGIKSLPGEWIGVFQSCSSLKKVTLPDGLEDIGENTFYNCGELKEIKLPPTVKTIGSSVFGNCSSLEEIRIPSSIVSIGSSAFSNCNNLKKVYTYTVEPTTIQENTFSTFQTATLYVPSVSFSNYYWDDGWKRFLNLEEFNEPYEYFYVNNDYILNENTGYIEGIEGNAPDADINAGGGFIVEGEQGDGEEPNQSLGNVNVGSDGNGNCGSIIGDNNLHIDDLHIKINVTGGRWYFFAFPFDIKMNKISMQNNSDFVFRYYDGEVRAKKGNGGWKDVNENHLKAARGYIFQCSANDVLVLSIEDVKFKKENKYNELVAHVSENLKDASWNFTGNPYLSYYDMADMNYTAPVTVWDGEKYVAIRPGDDDYHFAPYEAFFVQKPEGQESIEFDGEQQMTANQSEMVLEKQSAARLARSVDAERILVNIVMGDDTTSDRTRIVFNEKQSLAYETECDATKFESAGVAQIYTIGNDNVHYAINERPADNGMVMLGYSVPVVGVFTIDAPRMDVAVVLVDTKSGAVHDFAQGSYTFSSDAGTFNNRFYIKVKAGTTGIEDAEEVKDENADAKCEIYDLQGRKLNHTEKGIYIINGEKVAK